MYKNFTEAYRNIAKDLLENGKEVGAIRGRTTHEILNYSFSFEDITSNLSYIEGRKFNLMHGILESLGLFVPDNSVKFNSLFNERMTTFSDDGKTMYGNYGKRISGCLKTVIEKLKKDNNSRSAVLNIYNNSDLFMLTKDIPCTETIQFFVRDNKLHMIVNMRSNDMVWGTPYDVFMFTNLQMVIANTLGLEYGCYYHNVGSIHLYDDMRPLMEKLYTQPWIEVSKKNTNTFDSWYSLAINLSFYSFTDNYYLIRKVGNKMEDGIYANMVLKELEYKKGIVADIDNVGLSKETLVKYFCKRWKL